MTTNHIKMDSEVQQMAAHMTFKDEDFGQDIFNQFSSLRADGVLCDLTAVVGGTKIPLHKVIIVAVSDYFRDILLDNPDGPRDSVEFSDLDPEAFADVITYMYSGTMEMLLSNLDKVYLCATTLKLRQLTRWCLSMMSENISHDTVIDLLKSASEYNLQNLLEECQTYMAKNFLEICEKERFFTSSPETIEMLLKHEDLKTDSEMKVFVVFRKWAEQNKNMKAEATTLMENIKFGFITLEDNTSLLNDGLIQDEERSKHVKQAIEYIRCDNEAKHKFAGAFSTPRTAPSILIMGGMDKDEKELDTVVQVYMNKDAIKKKSQKFTKLPAPRFLASVVTCHNFVYVLGGKETTGKICNTVYCFNPLEKTWLTLKKMPIATCKSAPFVLDRVIFMAGGYNGDDKLRNVQRYTIAEDKWKKMRSLPYSISGAAAAMLNGVGYVSGGQLDGGNKSRDLLQYTLETDSWKKLMPMTEPRRSHSLVATEDKLIVIGGLPMTNVVESYDPSSEQWTILNPVPYFRRHTNALYHKGLIWVCAGLGTSRKSRSRPTETDTILTFEVEKGIWRETITSISYATFGCGCALIRLPLYEKK